MYKYEVYLSQHNFLENNRNNKKTHPEGHLYQVLYYLFSF